MAWIDQEPGWSALRAELAVVRRRMRQRWVLTALCALFVTAAVVGWKARQNPSYRAAIVIRLVEDGFDEETRPPSSRDITQYLYDIALSRPTLLSVIDDHELYPEQRFDPTWAIESMKDDIDITVVSNYFSPETYIENPVREARVVIGYTAREPLKALEVARQLGELIAERETEVRRRIAELTARAGADAKSALRNALIMARRDHIVLQMRRDKTPLDIVQIRRLEEEIKALDAELKLMSLTAEELSLRGELEQRSLGLRFEMVDEGRLPERRLSRGQSLSLLGLLVFFLSLPVVGVGVMALDTRIYDEDSLRRLGIASLGRIAPFRRAGTTKGTT